MTHDRDVERLLDTWFADGPSEAPDRVLDVVAARIHRRRQRPGWLVTRRTPAMPAPVRLLVIAALLIGALTVGSALLMSGVGRSGPTVTQPQAVAPTIAPPVFSASSSPEPTIAPTPALSVTPAAYQCADGTTTSCAGPLAAGTTATRQFEPAFSITVPDGYVNTFDITRTYSLKPFPPAFDIQVLSHLAIPEQNADCSAARKAGAGSAVPDWVDFITTHPGLVTGTPQPVTVDGHAGQRVQFRVSPDWTERCPDSISPAVVLFTDDGESPTRSIWFDDHRVTAWILDVDGETVIVHVDSGPSLNANDDDVRTFQPILDSMRFAAGG